MVGFGSVQARKQFTMRGIVVQQGDLVTDGSQVVRISHLEGYRTDARVRTVKLDGTPSYKVFSLTEQHSWWIISEHMIPMYQIPNRN